MARIALIPHLVLIAAVLGLGWPGPARASDEGVVRVEATIGGKTRFGSGFVVRTEADAAYVATAAHVVVGDPGPRVYFRSRPYSPVTARVVAQEGEDPNGLALLRIAAGAPAEARALPMAEGGGTDLQPGEAVTALGIPASIRNWAVLPGAVTSWKNRNILFSAGVDEGNSGGPLVKGSAVVGIVMRATRFGEAVPAISLRIFLQSNGVAWATQSPVPKAGEPFRDCPACPEMVVIPAGTFRMGSPDDEKGRDSDEGPVHSVRIAEPFALAAREVTVGEFRAFVEATGYRTEAEKGKGCAAWDGAKWAYDAKRSWRAPGFGQGEDHPVVCVSWNDARAYLEWLSQEAKRTYRLPSEAEWEYAARAGSTTARYWGEGPDAACDFANVADETSKRQYNWAPIHQCDDGFVNTAPVGSFKANAFGLEDMLGNVWEWTQDCWNDSYRGAPSDGTAWTGGDCGRRVVRGGSWGGGIPDVVRSANRDWFGSGLRFIISGFRPARTF